MKEITVLSGKGGTGKTSIVAALATLVPSAIFSDCDVDAANLHLILNAKVKKKHEFYGMKRARINPEKCIQCGKCQEECRFDAIAEYQVKELSCEGCFLCKNICPVEAIDMVDHLSGHLFISDTDYGPFVHAKLGIAEGNSGLLVSEVRRVAKALAEEKEIPLIITDGPPGIGCPVLSSLANTNLALIVAEPTASGIHDLERIVALAKNFKIQIAVCINKYNLNEENSKFIEKMADKLNIPIVGKISYDQIMHQAVMNKVPVTLLTKGKVKQEIDELWSNINNMSERMK